MSAHLRLPAPLRVLATTQFGAFFLGNGLSLTGTWMQRVACSWLVWDWTHSAFWVGVLAAGDLLPIVFIAPFAGVAADRWDRMRLNVIAQVVSAINALAIAVLLVAGQLGLTGVILLITIQGILTAITQPSRLAMVQQMVSREDVGTAVGLNSANVNLARLLGPALAGAMILHWQIVWVFIVNTVVTSLFVLILLRIRLAPRPGTRLRKSFIVEMGEGFTYVLRTPALRLILIAMLGGGAMVRAILELIPAFAAKSFGDEVTGLAVLTGAAAMGAIASGMTVRRISSVRLLYGVLIWWGLGGVMAIALTSARDPYVAVLAAVVLGGTVTQGLVSTQTFVQITTPDHLRGRALSVHGLVARGSPAIGALAIGFAADRIGLDRAVLVSSGLLFILILSLALPVRRAAAGVQDTY